MNLYTRTFFSFYSKKRPETTRPGGAGFTTSAHKVTGCHPHVDCGKTVNDNYHDKEYEKPRHKIFPVSFKIVTNKLIVTIFGQSGNALIIETLMQGKTGDQLQSLPAEDGKIQLSGSCRCMRPAGSGGNG